MSPDRHSAASYHAGVRGQDLPAPALSDHTSDYPHHNTRRHTPHQYELHLVSEPADPNHEIDDPILNAAVCELERLIVETRRAISTRLRFPALSSLVAIQPLVSHLLDSCNEKLNASEPKQNDHGDDPAGYL